MSRREKPLQISQDDLLKDLLTQDRQFKAAQHKYLMWNDYYSIVGLSRCIES
jgi:hypothetical protein